MNQPYPYSNDRPPPAGGNWQAQPPRQLPVNLTQPGVILWLRVFAGLGILVALGSLLLGIYGAGFAEYVDAAEKRENLLIGGFLIIFSLVILGLYPALLAAPRKPWFHTYATTVLAVSIVLSCNIFAIVLLIFWVQQPVRNWYNQDAHAADAFL